MIKVLFVCHGRTVKSLINQGIMGQNLVVNEFGDYGNTTNGEMKNRKCG